MPCSRAMLACRADCIHRAVVESYRLQRWAEEAHLERPGADETARAITFRAFLSGRPYPPAQLEDIA